MPPPPADWPGFAGGTERRGAVRAPREPELHLDNPRAWESPALPGRIAHAVSAFGELYLVVDQALFRIANPDAPMVQWPRGSLPQPVRESPGALVAERGLLFILTSGGAAVVAAGTMGPVRDFLPGKFEHQLPDASAWWLFEDVGNGAAILRRVARSTIAADPEEIGMVRMPAAPPIVCGGQLYWGGADGRVYRLHAGTPQPVAEAEGTVVAVAALDADAASPGVVFLTRDAAGEYRLHVFDHARPAAPQQVVVQGHVKPRIWVAGTRIYVATEGAAAELRGYHCSALSRAPELLTWPTSHELQDAVLLQAPRGNYLVLGRRDKSLGALGFSVLEWGQTGLAQLGRLLGYRQASLLYHRGLAVALLSKPGELKLIAYRLWT